MRGVLLAAVAHGDGTYPGGSLGSLLLVIAGGEVSVVRWPRSYPLFQDGLTSIPAITREAL